MLPNIDNSTRTFYFKKDTHRLEEEGIRFLNRTDFVLNILYSDERGTQLTRRLNTGDSCDIPGKISIFIEGILSRPWDDVVEKEVVPIKEKKSNNVLIKAKKKIADSNKEKKKEKKIQNAERFLKKRDSKLKLFYRPKDKEKLSPYGESTQSALNSEYEEKEINEDPEGSYPKNSLQNFPMLTFIEARPFAYSIRLGVKTGSKKKSKEKENPKAIQEK